MRRLRLILYIVCVAMLATACTVRDGECHDDKNVLLGCELYIPTYNSAQEAYQQQKLTTRVTAVGIGCDSLIYDGKVTSKVFLPLNKFDTISSFAIRRDSLATDTLTIYYTNESSFMSLECGCRVEHDIKGFDFTAAEIDSVTLIESHVANSQSIQLKLYFHNHE